MKNIRNMNKKEFLKKLESRVRDKEIVNYYDELISDRIESGESEESVVASYDLTAITSAIPLGEKSRISHSQKLFGAIYSAMKLPLLPLKNRTALTVYLSLFFITVPLTIAYWAIIFSLVVSAAAIVFSLVVTVISVIAVFGVTGVMCFIAAPCFAIMGLIDMQNSFASGITYIGGGIALIGLGIIFLWLLKLCNYVRILTLVKKRNRATALKEAKGKHRKLWCVLLYVIAPLTIIAGGLLFAWALYSVDWDISQFKDFGNVVEWFERNF